MGGINTLSGLNNVSVDFRPTIVTDVQKNGDANAPQQIPEADIAPENAPQPEKATAKSVVRELDVLLLNAAGKSVTTGVANRVKVTGKALLDLGVLNKEEVADLQRLSAKATDTLRALDKFSGRELANALMKVEDGETHGIDWNKTGSSGLNSTAKAVKEAIEAQQALSDAISNLTERLARSDKVNAKLQNEFTEIQFQCDRRVSEIDSIVFKMYQLVQQDVVNKVVDEPQVTALLNATFKELMPREAIMSHGTAEAFERINATFADKMRPLAKQLEDFAADGSRVLSAGEILNLKSNLQDMKSALENVRRNGIDRRVMTDALGKTILGDDNKEIEKFTEVDSALLHAMERLLDNVSKQIDAARKLSATRSRQAFVDEVVASLSPEKSPGGDDIWMSGPALGNPVLSEFRNMRLKFVTALRDFAAGKLTPDQFDKEANYVIARFDGSYFDGLGNILANVGFDLATVQSVVKAVGGLRLVTAQFKELVASSEKMMKDGGEDAGLATSDVRRIMLGEAGLSNVIEARSRGFKPGDVDPATEEQNIVGSSMLGSGVAGKTYLLTTKSGGEFVFKPELDGRIGLDNLLLGGGSAYVNAQTTANLNLATQDAAKAFGCENLVVKYSVGSHDRQFGIFMEKAKGFSGKDFAEKKKTGGGGITPADLHKTIQPGQEQIDVQGKIAQKLSKLQWLDLITGQNDRHWSNYFVHIDKDTREVTVKGIDNDASFSSWQIGLQKYALDKNGAARFVAKLKDVCEKIHGKGGGREYKSRVSKDPGITNNADGSLTVDLENASSPEIKMAIIATLGLQNVALPEEIDQDFYDKLMEMDEDPAKKNAYLDSIKPRISPDALKATESRLNEAIAYAKKLKADGKVYGEADWKTQWNLLNMSEIKSSVKIVKSDGKTITVKPGIGYVNDFFERDCPSLYKRDYFHQMLKEPQA